jgi:hypothetical protein
MKTEQMLKSALARYEEELGKIRRNLDTTKQILCGDLDTTNPKSVTPADKSRLATFMEERQGLQKQEQDMDFKIRFVKWVLE